MSRCALALIASAWMLIAREAAAGPESRVGLVVGVRVNVSEPRAEEVARAIERVLERELAVDVVVPESPEVARDLPPACATDSVCLSGVAARIEVDELLFLVVVGAGDRVRVELSRRHPVTGEVSHPPAVILDPDPDAMDRQIAAVARQLLPDAVPRAVPEPEPAPSASPPVAAPVEVDLDAGSGKRTAGMVIAAAGLALAGGATYFALASRSAADELEDRHPIGDPGTWTEKDRSLEDRHYRDRTIAVAFGIGAAAAVATGATVYLLGVRDRRRARGVALRPTIGGGLLVVGGAF
jgi:hypothetical protein